MRNTFPCVLVFITSFFFVQTLGGSVLLHRRKEFRKNLKYHARLSRLGGHGDAIIAQAFLPQSQPPHHHEETNEAAADPQEEAELSLTKKMRTKGSKRRKSGRGWMSTTKAGSP